MRIILASISARRKDLLALLQVPFDTVDPLFAEHPRADLEPAEQVRFFAEGKAQSCGGRFPDSLVIGSDTLIALDTDVLGKPRNLEEARTMLRRLRGRTHMLHTAVALVQRNLGVCDSAVETVGVRMRPLSDEEIEGYLRTGEHMGKAGAYAIQEAGADLIDQIKGDYTAVVGLPLRCAAELLQRHGIRLPVGLEELYGTKPYLNWGRFAAS